MSRCLMAVLGFRLGLADLLVGPSLGHKIEQIDAPHREGGDHNGTGSSANEDNNNGLGEENIV